MTTCVDCGRVVDRSPCTPCRAGRNRVRDAQRGSATARGYDGQWRRLVAWVLRRDEGICHHCGLTGADSGDHVIPLAHGGARLDPANVRAAHIRCNSSLGGRTRRR